MQLIGHKATKNQVKIALEAASKLNRSAPHMLFAGVAGCGKTSMAKYIASRSDFDFLQVPATDFKDHKSVLEVLENLNHIGYDRLGNRIGKVKPTVLFVDEVHAMPIGGQEPLGIAMEEYKVPYGKEGSCVWIPYFTLIGATTNDGILSKPFRERFQGMRFVFNTYSDEEIIKILGLHADHLGIGITPKSTREIAKRGRGVPRIAVSYLKRARDLCLSRDGNVIMHSMVIDTFDEMGIDDRGFTEVEIKILKALYDAGISIGLENLSIVVNESAKTLSMSAEPFLIREGMIIRSGKGRTLTRQGKEYLAKIGYAGKALKSEIPTDYVRK